MSALAEPLAELLTRLNGAEVPTLSLGIRQLCAALTEGHVCLPLWKLGPDAEAALRGCSVVGGPGERRPLILEHGRLYLARYHDYESRLAAKLQERAALVGSKPDRVVTLKLRKLTSDPDQQQAVVSALQRRLSIITGGPGTGKTRTATIALSLLAEHLHAQHPRIALAAPTGKAAARLSSSLSNTLAQIDLNTAMRAHLRGQASTIHRLLGAMPGESQFRYHADRPLPFDVVVVDEASMIDLPLMTKLLDALHPETRLILLGDRDQLASVEAGHVLGDICAAAEGELRACVTELTKNHRFADDSGIHRLAQALKAGDLPLVLDLLQSKAPDLAARQVPHRVAEALSATLVPAWTAVAQAATPEEALERMNEFRILCAVREGPQGVRQLNQAAERALTAAGTIHAAGTHYPGRPVLILKNDYQLRLFNGDLGLIRRDAAGELRAYFAGDDGNVREFAPARLPEHETAYAMTVHKSQGSEFESVLLVLPETDNPVMSRELLYTGVTRAKRQVHLWWSEESITSALNRRVVRWSGLRERMRAA